MTSLDRLFDLLEYLSSRRGGVSFGELKERGYTAPTLSRLLKDLAARDMVMKTNEGLYRLGPGTLSLARTLLGRAGREETMKPLVDELARRSGESAAYYEMKGEDIQLLVKREMAESFHYISRGSLNLQENHIFRLAMNDNPAPGKVLYEDWETAPGFYRMAVPVFSASQEGKPTGALGITFAKSKGTSEKRNEWEALIKGLIENLTLLS